MSAPCPFCQIVRGREEAEDFVTLDHMGYPDVATFIPLSPVVPGHRLYVPVTHIEDAGHDPRLAGKVFSAAADGAAYRERPFNLITSAGAEATQTVFHLHVHYVPRDHGDGLQLPWTLR